MTSLTACIPSIGLSSHVYGLANVLVNDGVAVRVYVNDPSATFDERKFDPTVELHHMHGRSIYDEWNDAVRWAGDSHVLLTNDDVVLLPGTARALSDALDAHPDYGVISVGETHPVIDPRDVYPIGHHLGNRRAFMQWCFIARTAVWQDVDFRYKIWYGDDDLIWKMCHAGQQVGVLRGVGVTHHVSTTSHQLPWVGRAAQQDAALWASTH